MTARCVSPTARGAALGVAATGGGDGGRVKQKTAATKYSAATTRMTACGPATLMTSGPSSAKPTANAALRVRVKTPFADSSCGAGTTSGIIAASAGAKNTVTVEMKMLSSRISSEVVADEEERDDRERRAGRW